MAIMPRLRQMLHVRAQQDRHSGESYRGIIEKPYIYSSRIRRLQNAFMLSPSATGRGSAFLPACITSSSVAVASGAEEEGGAFATEGEGGAAGGVQINTTPAPMLLLYDYCARQKYVPSLPQHTARAPKHAIIIDAPLFLLSLCPRAPRPLWSRRPRLQGMTAHDGSTSDDELMINGATQPAQHSVKHIKFHTRTARSRTLGSGLSSSDGRSSTQSASFILTAASSAA